MIFKIATWNVNSLRVRLPHVLEWMEKAQPDVLALQEIKLIDADFPLKEIEARGYKAIYSGQRTYNGVAVLTREVGQHKVTDIPGWEDPQRRLLAVTMGDVRIVNVYIPNGESVDSDKYHYKLNWLQHFTTFLKNELQTYSKLIVLGDFNIAPNEDDVHDPKLWEGRVLFSEQERKAFATLLQQGLIDCFRLHPQQDKSFSWWDYRMNSFKRNLGMRIDHILSSSTLALQCTKCYIDKLPRGWERPSDHTPVVGEFRLDSL